MPDILPTVQGDQGNIEALPVYAVNAAGTGPAIFVPTSTGAVHTSVTSSATAVSLLANNFANRKGATIYNESTSVLYVKFGSGATTASYALQMAPNTYYEVPFGYGGAMTGIWVTANGFARVTEFT